MYREVDEVESTTVGRSPSRFHSFKCSSLCAIEVFDCEDVAHLGYEVAWLFQQKGTAHALGPCGECSNRAEESLGNSRSSCILICRTAQRLFGL
jgi:hypothetical protein